MPLTIAALVFVTVLVVFGALVYPSTHDESLRARLDRYSTIRASEPDDLSRPLAERVLIPAMSRFGRAVTTVAPSHIQAKIQARLDQAGNPLSVEAFMLGSLGAIVVPSSMYVGLLAALGAPGVQPRNGLTLVFLLGAGAFLPRHWLNSRAEARQHAVQRALPDALDLLVVSMEAGLSLDSAMARVVEKTTGPLRDEFRRALREIQLGGARREAFRRIGTRTGVSDVINFFNSIVQADQMGVGLGLIMRVQADEARVKRGQRAEERAHKAAVKMLFPLIMFILPSVMVVAVGPAVVALAQIFGGAIKLP